MANHASTRTTQLYDRRAEEVTLDEVERILFETGAWLLLNPMLRVALTLFCGIVAIGSHL